MCFFGRWVIMFVFAAFDEWPRYTTPEILLRACPPYGKLGLDHCAHRFTSQFGVDKKKETCSRAFGACRTWQEALAEVHDFLWGKFLETGKAVPDGTVLQVPGEAPAHVMSDMAAVILSLPERKQYGPKGK